MTNKQTLRQNEIFLTMLETIGIPTKIIEQMQKENWFIICDDIGDLSNNEAGKFFKKCLKYARNIAEASSDVR